MKAVQRGASTATAAQGAALIGWRLAGDWLAGWSRAAAMLVPGQSTGERRWADHGGDGWRESTGRLLGGYSIDFIGRHEGMRYGNGLLKQ